LDIDRREIEIDWVVAGLPEGHSGYIEGQAGVTGLGQVDPTRSEVEGIRRGLEIFLDHGGLGGRHQRRFDLSGSPVGVQRNQQGGSAGHLITRAEFVGFRSAICGAARSRR
jgi:hypothetical protein